MSQTITAWLEEQTGETRRQMALKLGQSPSTFNRNIERAEVVVAVCRAYNISPVEGLIAAKLLTEAEVQDAAAKMGLSGASEKSLLEEMLRRVTEGDHEYMDKELHIGDDGFPDYSKMSEADAYDLAAEGEDENIGDDELPSTP